MMSSSHKAQKISSVEALIRYDFKNKDICWEALSTKGATSDFGIFTQGNKNLALLGDSLIKSRRLQDWISTGTPTQVGNSYANDITTNTSLMSLGKARELGTFMNLNPSLRGKIQDSQIADAVEALVGAVDCDGGNRDEKDRVMAALGLL